jgi:SAM-dependent methyltransferase
MTVSLFESLLNDVEKHFSGWDFSFVTETGRMESGMISWSYGSLAIPLIRNAKSLLDMGTGGGELLSKLQPFPPSVCATEGYAPNIPVAKKCLEPLGVRVEGIDGDDNLPFEANQFDLIINKHESYSPGEVNRVLSPGGTFLTQQVGGEDCNDINRALGAPINDEFLHWNLEYAHKQLEEEGFDILLSKEELSTQRFYDIGALVYYLKAIPWQVPDFSIEKYHDPLFRLHQSIEEKGFFEAKQNRFILKAQSQD